MLRASQSDAQGRWDVSMLPSPPTRGPVITPMSGWASRSSKSLLVLAKYNMRAGGAGPHRGQAISDVLEGKVGRTCGHFLELHVLDHQRGGMVRVERRSSSAAVTAWSARA
ncbi:hypothetical protein GCM10008019_16160 [Deinococcus soli (ex Cha et al. 2016)]|nr:hypothetical protein GCM10008019_16160 [Deinococcus soli (ex Cha et al. 2016)]